MPVGTLSQQDRDRIARAAAILAEAADSGGLPERVFRAISAVVETDLLSYNDVNLDTGEARFVLRPGRTVAAGGPTPFLRRFGYHPAATGAFGPVSGEAVPRFVADPKLRALGVGNCCGDAEISLNAGVALAEAGARRVGIGISRAVRDFDARDQAVLHAVQALLIAAFRASLEASPPKPPTVPAPPSGHVRLTRRENEILYWVAMGKTNGEIATILGAKPLTVKKHLEHVYEKLEVPNRTAAAAAAFMVGTAATLVLPG